jgi:putative transposase
VKTAQRLLLDLARWLEAEYPTAAESVREGLDETLTVLTLKLPPRLAARWRRPTPRRVSSAGPACNVKRWRGGEMMLRWAAAAIFWRPLERLPSPEGIC